MISKNLDISSTKLTVKSIIPSISDSFCKAVTLASGQKVVAFVFAIRDHL